VPPPGGELVLGRGEARPQLLGGRGVGGHLPLGRVERWQRDRRMPPRAFELLFERGRPRLLPAEVGLDRASDAGGSLSGAAAAVHAAASWIERPPSIRAAATPATMPARRTSSLNVIEIPPGMRSRTWAAGPRDPVAVRGGGEDQGERGPVDTGQGDRIGPCQDAVEPREREHAEAQPVELQPEALRQELRAARAQARDEQGVEPKRPQRDRHGAVLRQAGHDRSADTDPGIRVGHDRHDVEGEEGHHEDPRSCHGKSSSRASRWSCSWGG
jgi:hypothetical protein